MIQLGHVPQRIDLLTSISGVEVADAFRNKISADLEDVPVFMLTRNC
jgi:hypothetical protein